MESGTRSILPFSGYTKDHELLQPFKNYLSVSLRSVIKSLCDVLKATLSVHRGSKSITLFGFEILTKQSEGTVEIRVF